jgi:diacylglycerol kinase family enzyme
VLSAAIFLRRQAADLVKQAVPYVRRKATIERPVLIINPWSGDGKAGEYDLATVAEDAGIETIVMQSGDELEQLAIDAIRNGADAIGMAGGDGSLAIVAGVAIEHDLPFFCIPIGTRNHFALDLGLDRDNPLSALDAIRDGEEVLVDHGRAGDRLFLNNISFGVYAQAVHEDGYREQKDKAFAKVIEANAANVDAQAALRYQTPDGKVHERAPLLLISNNPYRFSGPPDFGRRFRLDSGQLGVNAVTSLPKVIDAATALLGEGHDLYEWQTSTIQIESEQPILAGIDGEAVQFDSPLEVAIRPKTLRVLVPTGTRPGYVPPREKVAARVLDLAHLGGASPS